MEVVKAAEVVLWGRVIGALVWDDALECSAFEYSEDFLKSGIEVAPLEMPLRAGLYSFPGLNNESFRGLPGLLADALPDKFGNALIDQWLVRRGRSKKDFSPVERLCYQGARGMGALEFRPSVRRGHDASAVLEVDALVDLASQVLSERKNLSVSMTGDVHADEAAIRDILRVGTSAGGARAKAIVAWNERTGELRSGQVVAPDGFTYWLMKFDGVSENRDKELNDPLGYGKIEYAYHLMAKAAGITMEPCRLHHENGRSHFMTRRFDRTAEGKKIMMQSLCAIAHMDFNMAGAYSYEQALDVCLKLGLSLPELRELFRRMVFNVCARNQDDHTKNIAFLMNKTGQWSLSPAFDVVYSYNANGDWTSQHQMTVNGKRDGFDRADLHAVAERFNLGKRAYVESVIEEVLSALGKWEMFANAAGVPESWMKAVNKEFRKL